MSSRTYLKVEDNGVDTLLGCLNEIIWSMQQFHHHPCILPSSQFCISNEKTAFVGAYIVGSRNAIKKPQEYVSVIAPNN